MLACPDQASGGGRPPSFHIERLLFGDESLDRNFSCGSLWRSLHSAESLLTGGRGVPMLPLGVALLRDR